jgi:hypothetical protein
MRASRTNSTLRPSSLTRRSFLGRAAAGLFTAMAHGRAAWAQSTAIQSLRGLPTLEGQILLDAAERQAVAGDYGGHVSQLPITEGPWGLKRLHSSPPGELPAAPCERPFTEEV